MGKASLLCEQDASEAPSEKGLLVRIGRAPEMPLATIRGAWGFEKARLGVINVHSALFRHVPDISAQQNVNVDKPALSPFLRHLFLTGELCSRPALAPPELLPELLSQTGRLAL